MFLKSRKVLIYGFSDSGKQAALLALSEGADVYVYDDGNIPELTEGVTLVTSEQAAPDADIVIISPGVPFDRPLLERARLEGKEVIGETEFAYRFCKSDIIAVTGTNGKTTTTMLINRILNMAGQSSYALGNIGIPLSAKVKELQPSQTVVLEVSSFQLESTVTFSPDISVILNLAPDHIDRHGSYPNYINAKCKIFENQVKRDKAVLNYDDADTQALAQRCPADVFYFSKSERVRGAYVKGGRICFEDKRASVICPVKDLSFTGGHNLDNALAAVAAAKLKGVDDAIISHALKTFELPDFRMQFIGSKCGKDFYNDSKGTNVAATLAAVRSVSGDSLLILGGSDKGENFDDLFANLPDSVKYVLVSGANADKITESAARCKKFNVFKRDTLENCVTESLSFSVKNVIFSPSSASFDRFIDYKDRGRAFNRYFNGL